MGLVARFPRPVVDLPPSVLQRRMRRMAIRPASEIMVCCKLDRANYATLPLVSRLRFSRGCIDNGTDGMTMACAALSRSLDRFYVPQLEQVGPASVTCKGRSLFARVMNESCAGYLLAFEVNPSCILVIHEIDVRKPLRIEEDLPEHACLCVCSRDSLAGVPKDARKRHGERSSVAFAQSAERFTMPMNPGERFKSTSLCLLPAYFDEIEKRFPDDFRGLGEKVMSHGVMPSSIQIDRILNGLTATSMLGPGALPLLEAKVLEATCYLNKIIEDDHGAADRSHKRRTTATAADIMKIVELSMPNPPTLEQLCAIAHKGHTTLSEMFKRDAGMPLGEYVRGMRMKAAKGLLADTDLSAAEIGEMVGYGDAASFAKAFKRHVGMTPGAYRNTYAQR